MYACMYNTYTYIKNKNQFIYKCKSKVKSKLLNLEFVFS